MTRRMFEKAMRLGSKEHAHGKGAHALPRGKLEAMRLDSKEVYNRAMLGKGRKHCRRGKGEAWKAWADIMPDGCEKEKGFEWPTDDGQEI